MALTVGDVRLNLVQTVSALVAPVIERPDYPVHLLPPAQAAEIIARTVLSHALIERSALSDEQVADAVARAISLTATVKKRSRSRTSRSGARS